MTSSKESGAASEVSPIDNEPNLSPPPRHINRGTEESETCRICRGEGTKDETLFYPCKCSGSIKFVHQDCLMEWLSHSQKKHCELCKTPFRFTKLYHPQMPSTIPTTVFISRATLHIVKNFLLWCRAVLVTFIWVFFLPWSIRWAWRSLFWVADGGWARTAEMNLNATTTEVAVERTKISALTSAPFAIHKAKTIFWNTSFNWSIFGYTLGYRYKASILSDINSSPAVTLIPATSNEPDSSLLSSFNFFKNLTPYPTFNKFVADVLEGQIITLCVVVAFILVFLIREWVIQQQPVIHLAALDEDQQDMPDVEPQQIHSGQQPEAGPALPTVEDVDALKTHLQNTQDGEHEVENDDENPVTEGLLNSSEREDRRYAARMVLVHQMLSAIETHTKEAIEKRDFEILLKLKTILGRFTELISLLPGRYHSDLEAAINATEKVIEKALAHLNQDSRSTQDVQLPPTPIEPCLSDVASSSSTSSGFRARPPLPTRPDSSLASEIQRSLEENDRDMDQIGADSQQLGEQTTESSISSSESWQIPDSWEDEANSRNQETYHSSLDSNTREHDISQSSSAAVSVALVRETALPLSTSSGTSDVTRVNSSHEPTSGRPEEKSFERENMSQTTNSGDLSVVASPGDSHTQPNDRPRIEDFAQGPLMEPTEVVAEEIPAPLPLVGRLLDWMWGDDVPADLLEPNGRNDAHVVRDVQEEAPFVPFVNARPENRDGQNADNVIQEPDVAAAAADHAGHNHDEPGVDADAEDLEGIMELIGMQGPLVGLLQNAIFSAVLIFLTLSSCVWLPYIWGKVVILFAANPFQLAFKIPVQLISVAANLVVDFCIFFAAMMIHWIELMLRSALRPFTLLVKAFPVLATTSRIGKMSGKLADAALLRMVKIFVATSDKTDSDYFHLSLNSHAALRSLQTELYASFLFVAKLLWELYGDLVDSKSTKSVADIGHAVYRKVIMPLSDQLHLAASKTLVTLASILQSNAQPLQTKFPTDSPPLDLSLAYWNATDRLIAVLAGYGFFALIGTIYLSRGGPITSSPRGRRIEAALTEFLLQAGGVLKVILIISIEMIVFPLYCGFLLDIAMLPLFEQASFLSRLDFTIQSPWTSVFVHWFIGTCYMFHFALFVSMCRKILRTGVLYFIRDPDDPTFHPIRDVLERPVTSQLRKIAFSGVVYGALVIVCLGSVVWAINYTFAGFLPVHWTSGNPIIGFPIDLLMYNFLMPLVLRTTRPSKGLHKMYDWWFRKCARQLRLTQFLFGEQQDDEEGNPNSGSGAARKEGRYVRAPASDQVRIPKDRDVFLEVDQDNNRLDGMQDQENGTHGRNDPQFTKVYIPPWFTARIALFVICLWALTAVLGLVLTVLPLILGRRISSYFTNDKTPVNDIHAFAIGIYIFGGALHLALKHMDALKSLVMSLKPPSSLPTFEKVQKRLREIFHTAQNYTLHALSVFYTYSAFVFLVPSLLALLLQFYAIMPLRTYLQAAGYSISITQILFSSSDSASIANNEPAAGPHHIQFLQDWALGLLYLRIAIRLILHNETSRPARALRCIVQNGWLRPNARLATRCFIVPTILLSLAALLIPAPLGWLAGRFLTSSTEAVDPKIAAASVKVLAYRFAYPAVLSVGLIIWAGFGIIKATARWRLRIRDEVYLIGERLHNFGEKRPVKSAVPEGSEETKARVRRLTL